MSNSENLESTGIREAEVWAVLDAVSDPEIPVISVVELGIVRDITIRKKAVEIDITPTFSGCPALHVIVENIRKKLISLGLEPTVHTVHHPPWSSDWISESGRKKLKDFGLSPPPVHGGRIELTFYEPVPCPYCDSKETVIRNSFGPTICRAIYTCQSCQQPFEQFKPL